MFPGKAGQGAPGLRFLFMLAVIVVLVHGLQIAQPIMLPAAVAVFLAITSLPIVAWLRKKRFPNPLAILLTVLAVAAVFGLAILFASQQLAELQAGGPAYVEAVIQQVNAWLQGVEQRFPFLVGVRDSLIGFLNSALLDIAGETFTWALSFASTTFLVFLILAFALSEAAILPGKLQAVAGGFATSDERLGKIVQEVQGYLVIKTLVSLGTGLMIGLWTWAVGLESPILLGLVAFVLNYVPTIGSVIASVPAVVLALVDFDLQASAMVGFEVQRAIVVGLGYLAVNVLFGNWLEPTLLGRRLGLSTLVVVLSLVFWGWVWGPVGALLSVPLTVVVKIMLENTQDLKWVAVLLDKEAPAAGPEAQGA